MAGDIEANSTKGQMQRKTRWSGLTGLFFLLWTVVAGVDISYPLYTNGIHWKNSEISAVDWTLLVERFVGLFMILLATPCAIFSIADTSLDQWGLLCVLGFSIQSFCISILILGTVYFNSLLPLVFEASLLLQDSASMYFSVIFSYGGTLFIAVAFAALEIAGMLFALKVAYPRRLKGRSGYCYGGAVGFGFGLSTFLVSSFIQHVELIPINCGLSHDVVHTMSQRGGLVFVKTCAGAILGSNVLRSSRTEVAYDVGSQIDTDRVICKPFFVTDILRSRNWENH